MEIPSARLLAIPRRVNADQLSGFPWFEEWREIPGVPIFHFHSGPRDATLFRKPSTTQGMIQRSVFEKNDG